MTSVLSPYKESLDKSSNTLIVFIWCIIIAFWGLLTAMVILISIYKPGALGDFRAYYNAAQRINNGQSLYISIEASNTYLYPPLLAQIIAPFEAHLTFTETAIIWIIVNIFCLILATILVTSEIRQQWKRYIVWLMPLLFLPIIDTFNLGQVVPILYLLITGAMIAHKRNHPILAGTLLAFATWLKVYPLLIIIYFIFRRDWYLVISTFIVGMCLLFLQLGVSGLDILQVYFTETLFKLAANGQSFNMHHNHSILGFSNRFFVDTSMVKLFQWTITGLMIVLMLIAGKKSWRKTSKELDREEFDIDYSLVVIFMLLMSGTLFSGSMLLILLPLAIALNYASKLKHIIIIAISFLMMSLTFGFISTEALQTQHPIVQGYGFYGVFMLWGLLVYLRWEKANYVPDTVEHQLNAS